MSTAPQQSASTEKTKKIASALLRYRILAYTTGVWLLVLLVEIVAKYGFGNNSFGWVGIVHGWVYAVYLVFTLDLAIKVRWPAARTVGTLLAGTVPFLSFFVEHWRTTQVKRDFGV